PGFVPGEVIVGAEDGGERLLRLPEGIGVGEAARALEANPSVAYALPNYIARASAVPNDPGQGTVPGDWQRTQWNFLACGSICTLNLPPASGGSSTPGVSPTPGLYEARGGINAVGAWDVLKQRGGEFGKGATVAVLDTGVAYRSKRPAFSRSPDFGKRQFLPGLDVVKGNDVPLDRDGHGTHVAGTIGERAGNGFGLTGLVPKAGLIPIRVLDANGLGNARDIAEGIRYASREGADVINMSFEFALVVDSCAQIKSVCSAIKFASKRGAVIVSAAGNSNGEPIAFPAGAPGVIGVGRTTKDACLAGASRTGAGLDLVAPGGGLPAAADCGGDDPYFSRGAPIQQLTFSGSSFSQFGYPTFYEGTSMAAAHAAGVAAMVIASKVVGRNPSPATVECQLKATARTTDLGQLYDPRLFGAGLIDAGAAVLSRAPGC
ncbi:MAG: S8 family serine peptidase, partial [Solirubrobacterales bacterium]|nr:S8 family serine peptidase [Solirubrobacterales bacterium]